MSDPWRRPNTQVSPSLVSSKRPAGSARRMHEEQNRDRRNRICWNLTVKWEQNACPDLMQTASLHTLSKIASAAEFTQRCPMHARLDRVQRQTPLEGNALPTSHDFRSASYK